MKTIPAVLVLACSVALLAPAMARASGADSLAVAPRDSLTRAARVDSLGAARRDSLARLQTIVRVPAGTNPLRPPAPAPPPRPTRTRDGMVVPDQRFYLLAGLGFPAAPSWLTHGWNPGGAVGGGLDLVFNPRLSLRVRGEWSSLPFDERRFLKSIGRYGTGAQVEGGKASLVQVSLLPRWQTLSSAPRFFVEAGPGLGMVRVADALLYDPFYGQLFQSVGESVFAGGISAGAGVEFLRHDGSGVFVDLHWNTIFAHANGGAKEYVPLTVGIIFPQ